MMLLIWIISFLVLLIFGGIYALINPVIQIKKINKNEEIRDIPVQKNRLYTDVETLCSILPARNSENIESLNQAADYILSEFQKLNCQIEIQEYQTPDKKNYKNIIASFLPPKTPYTEERIIIGAHYDVCGNQAGADDNASAVAGLLETARLIHEQKPNLKHRIDFVAFSLEEPPYFATQFMGSAVHAKSLKEKGIKIKAMICLEMIGYFTDTPNSQNYPVAILKTLYPSVGNFIAVVSKIGQNRLTAKVKKYMLEVASIPVYSINAPTQLAGIDFSDHRNYWQEGYPAVMINDTSFYRNPNYHQKTDTMDSLDFEKVCEVVKGIYWALINL